MGYFGMRVMYTAESLFVLVMGLPCFLLIMTIYEFHTSSPLRNSYYFLCFIPFSLLFTYRLVVLFTLFTSPLRIPYAIAASQIHR
jgi:hypothetical protein